MAATHRRTPRSAHGDRQRPETAGERAQVLAGAEPEAERPLELVERAEQDEELRGVPRCGAERGGDRDGPRRRQERGRRPRPHAAVASSWSSPQKWRPATVTVGTPGTPSAIAASVAARSDALPSLSAAS